MTGSRRIAGPRRAAVVVATVLALGALPGCAGLEGIVEQVTGGDVEIGGSSIPADFPADVPVAEGEIVNGSALSAPGGERVWNVVVASDDPDAPATVSAGLEAAGFTAPLGGASGETLVYLRDDLTVTVVLLAADPGWTINYTVARAAA